jgi:hypothetical protein
VQDSGIPHVEFRVQCEVQLSASDAALIQTAFAERTFDSLEEALEVVLANIDPDANEEFREIVRLAFIGQPEYQGASALTGKVAG